MMGALLLAASSLCAQTQKPKVTTTEVKASINTRAENYAEIKFDTLRHNFGKFSKADPIVKCTFGFTNTGTAPLIINQAFATCRMLSDEDTMSTLLREYFEKEFMVEKLFHLM